MADLGHELTDKKLKALEKRVAEEYKIALADMEEKLRKYLEETEVKRQYWEGLWKAGEITESEYRTWCYNHTMVGKRWEKMRDVLAEDMEHANEIALKIAHKEMPDIYALNANYEMYHIEHGGKIETGFTLYSHDTAEYLLGDQRQLMPKPSAKKAAQIAANESMQWNKQKIQSAVLQGVLQGENPVKVAQRLQSVAQMNYNDAVRYARTMTTSAQNAGRYEAIHEATRLGVDLTIEWQATLDHRTRHAHRQMHGQRTEVDEPFHTPDGYTIYYPADCTGRSTAPQHEIWNCRCTLLAWVKGYEPETVRSSPKMGDMTYEEWLEEKPVTKPLPTDPEEKKVASKATKKPKENEKAFQSRFEPAKDIKEAENFIKQIVNANGFGALGVDYTGIDLEVANIVNKTLIDLYDEFNVPMLGGVVAPAGNTKLGKQIQNATAAYSPIRNSFLLNRKSLKNVKTAEKALLAEKNAVSDILTHPERYDLSKASSQLRRVIEASRESGRGTVPETIQDVLSHEFGHALEKQIKRSDSFEQIKNNMPEYARKISGYASEDISEYIAESFVSWRKGETLIDPVLKTAFEGLRRKT